MRPAYAHANQRSRLWHGDSLFQTVETIPTKPWPQPIPVGEASFLPWREVVNALRPAASSTLPARNFRAVEH